MSTPRPPAMTSRLNTGGYGVNIAGGYLLRSKSGAVEHYRPSPYEAVVLLQILSPNNRWMFTLGKSGTVAPDGSLTVEPERWAARHYRRAVMAGAGVYRWGLWAFLGAGRAAGGPQVFTVPSGEHVEPYRVIVRGRDVLAPDLPHVDVGRVAPGQSIMLAGYRQRAVYYAQAVMRGAGVYQAGLWAMLAGRAQTDPAQVVESGAALGVNDAQAIAFEGHSHLKHRYIASGVAGVARWVEYKRFKYWQYLARGKGRGNKLRGGRPRNGMRHKLVDPILIILKALHRERSRSVTRQRPPTRPPRPLYSRAIPPAAPLAPPAL